MLLVKTVKLSQDLEEEEEEEETSPGSLVLLSRNTTERKKIRNLLKVLKTRGKLSLIHI